MELEALFDAETEFNFYQDEEFEGLDDEGMDQFWSDEEDQMTLLD